MPEIIAIIGGQTSNSWVTLEWADNFLDARLDADAWRETDSENRVRALITATDEISQVKTWLGEKANRDQRLPWPRANVPKPDGVGGFLGSDYLGAGASLAYRSGYGFYGFPRGEVYPSTEIPQEIMEAEALLALALLEGWRKSGEQVSRYAMDGLSVERDIERSASALPVEVQERINGLMQGDRLERG